MVLWVQKYGGSLLKSYADYDRVASHILSCVDQGVDVVAVVSAMYKKTDELLNMALNMESILSSGDLTSTVDSTSMLSQGHALAEMDMLLATGEMVSASLLALALRRKGLASVALNAYSAGIYGHGQYAQAIIEYIDDTKISAYVAQGVVPVVCGFQAIDQEGHLMTLGRGGSDISSVAIAAALKADQVQLFKDVEGIFPLDPKHHKSQRGVYHTLSSDLMYQAAKLGAKVLHPRAISCAVENNIALNMMKLGTEKAAVSCTIVADEKKQLEPCGVKIITHQSHQCLLTVQCHRLNYAHLLTFIKKITSLALELSYDIQSMDDACYRFSAVVGYTKQPNDLVTLKALISSYNVYFSHISYDFAVSKISLAGYLLSSQLDIHDTLHAFFHREDITIHRLSIHEERVCFWVDEQYVDVLLPKLNAQFIGDAVPA